MLSSHQAEGLPSQASTQIAPTKAGFSTCGSYFYSQRKCFKLAVTETVARKQMMDVSENTFSGHGDAGTDKRGDRQLARTPFSWLEWRLVR